MLIYMNWINYIQINLKIMMYIDVNYYCAYILNHLFESDNYLDSIKLRTKLVFEQYFNKNINTYPEFYINYNTDTILNLLIIK